jgi:hypothetical protein
MRGMMRILVWVLTVGSLVGWFAGGMTEVRAEDRVRELYVTDVLTFPGKTVQLQARLTEQGPEGEQGLAKEPVEFFLQGQAVGEVATDAQGWARLEFTPKMRGNLELRAKWGTSAKREMIEGKGVLLSWERRRPILLIDLAVLVEGELETESPRSELFPDSGLVLGEPQVAAPAELWKLAEFYYNLVYIDRTGKGRVEAIQSWLRKHKFPPGMIRTLPQTPTALPEVLQALQEEGWENVSGGIGQTVDFAEVLLKNRLQAIILPRPGNQARFPRRAILLNDWSRVRRYL